MGYGHAVSSQKGWRILMQDTNTVATTTDVTFGKSLSESVSARPAELTSTDSFAVDDRHSSSLVSPRPGLPNSLNFTDSPMDRKRPVTRSMAKSTDSALPLTSSLRPTKSEPSTPVSPSVVSAPSSSASPVIRSPHSVDKVIDPNVPVATPVTHRRPVGRPPANSRWDPNLGQYVRVLSTSKLPTPSQVWSLVTRKVHHDDDTPLSYHEATTGPNALQWLKAIES